MSNVLDSLVFRKATFADISLLAHIGASSFSSTYGDQNTQEDMQSYIATHFTDDLLLAEVNDPDTLFFIIEKQKEVAGYIKLKFSIPDQGEFSGTTLEIARFYVMQPFIGTGVGNQMMQFVLDFSKSHACSNLWLIVWQENRRAIEFYKKWGFEIFAATKFKLGADIQDDWMMKKHIMP